MPIGQNLNYNTGASAMQMAQTIFGPGTTILSANYTGDARSSAIYSGADTISPGVAPADSGVILSTGRATDFTSATGNTNTNVSPWTSTNTKGPNGDPDFNALAGTQTYDASFLEVTFIPDGSQLTLDFVLASEEYPEWVGSQFNDVVGVWVDGAPAQIGTPGGVVSIGNLSPNTAPNLYVDNTGDQYNTEMDGFTLKLSFIANVTPGKPTTIKIGVADVSDSLYDTNLLIAANSVQTAIVAGDDAVNAGLNSSKTIDVLANDQTTAPGGVLTITHINGIAVNPGDSVTLKTGQTITLNADGTLTVTTTGTPQDVQFNYTIQDATGKTDAGLVTVHQMACYGRGTRILTATGWKPIERIRPGERVVTADRGTLPVLWIGSRQVLAGPEQAPVRIRAGALGNAEPLTVSPMHRMAISGWAVELLFGVPEVFVRADALVGLPGVERLEPGPVELWHLLLAEHAVIWAEGLASESLYPGPEALAAWPEADRDAIHAALGRAEPGDLARPMLKAFEARALVAELARGAAAAGRAA